MRCRYRSQRSLKLRNLILQVLPKKFSHKLNVIKNLNLRPLDPEIKLLKSYLLSQSHSKSDATTIDIGANIGLYSALFVSAGCKVVAFEPQHRLATNLKQIFVSNVKVHEVALSDRRGVARLRVPRIQSRIRALGEIDALATISEAERLDDEGIYAEDVFDVPMAILDDYAEAVSNCVLIKIDVEGSEIEVLRGARDLLSNYRPVIFSEVATRNIANFVDLVNVINYRPFFYDPHIKSLLRLERDAGEEIAAISNSNYFAIPNGAQSQRIFFEVCRMTSVDVEDF
jgi:FkbM family methyltransferase